MAVLRPTDSAGRFVHDLGHLGLPMRTFDSLRPSAFVLVTGLGLALGLGGLSCNLSPVSVFTCSTTEDCVAEAGMGAICEPNSLCTVPDPACPSMKRWHDRAAELAGKCYEDSDLGGTDSIAGTAGSSTGGGETTGGSVDPSTTTPAEESGDSESSGSPPPMTDSGDSTTGMAGTCNDLFGMAPAYELCEETPDSCSFNAMTDGGSCDEMCMMFGATCITSFTNDMSDCASMMDEVACTEVAGDNICVCAKP